MGLAYTLLVFTVWFLSTYFNIVLLLILFNKKSELYASPAIDDPEKLPLVSILVPAYNESKVIEENISSLKSIDYPKGKVEIIIINDGSTDNTREIVGKQAEKDYIIFIDNKKNKGKAACLNQGISKAKGEFVACMDADSEVSSDILKKTIPYFKDNKVSAVTVTVEVKNPKNFLQRIIEIEYIIGLSLALKALSFFNSIHVTPGPFSIYRKSIFSKIGLFDVNNITEDLEIAYRMQKHGFKIANCISTKVRTLTPDNFKSLHAQRKRWYSGALVTLWQHKNILFNTKIGAFGFVVPYTFVLVVLGLLLFFSSIYLTLSNFIRSISFYSLTNFNFLSYLSLRDLDMLHLGVLTIFGVSSVLMVIIAALTCLRLANKDTKKMISGFIGFIFIFFLYQIFWASSFYSVLLGKNIKWR